MTDNLQSLCRYYTKQLTVAVLEVFLQQRGLPEPSWYLVTESELKETWKNIFIIMLFLLLNNVSKPKPSSLLITFNWSLENSKMSLTIWKNFSFTSKVSNKHFKECSTFVSRYRTKMHSPGNWPSPSGTVSSSSSCQKTNRENYITLQGCFTDLCHWITKLASILFSKRRETCAMPMKPDEVETVVTARWLDTGSLLFFLFLLMVETLCSLAWKCLTIA